MAFLLLSKFAWEKQRRLTKPPTGPEESFLFSALSGSEMGTGSVGETSDLSPLFLGLRKRRKQQRSQDGEEG